ncbi:unnamed protein product, partial [marine sediment metagenome]
AVTCFSYNGNYVKRKIAIWQEIDWSYNKMLSGTPGLWLTTPLIRFAITIVVCLAAPQYPLENRNRTTHS